MTEPRRWTIYEYRDGHVESVRFNLSQQPVRVLAVGPEDREAVEALIAQALVRSAIERDDDRTLPEDWTIEVRAVFDALNGGDKA